MSTTTDAPEVARAQTPTELRDERGRVLSRIDDIIETARAEGRSELTDAEIVSIRSAADLMEAVTGLTPEQRAELARLLSSSNTSNNPDTPIVGLDAAPAPEGTAAVTPDEDPSTVDPDRGDIDLLALANERRRLDS